MIGLKIHFELELVMSVQSLEANCFQEKTLSNRLDLHIFGLYLTDFYTKTHRIFLSYAKFKHNGL